MEHVVSLWLQLLQDKLEKLVLSVAHSVIPVAFVFYFFWVLGSMLYRWVHFLSGGVKIPMAVNKVLSNLMYFHISKKPFMWKPKRFTSSQEEAHVCRRCETCSWTRLCLSQTQTGPSYECLKQSHACSRRKLHLQCFIPKLHNSKWFKTNGGPPRHGPPCF